MEIKGIKEGILITLENQSWQDAKKALIDKIKEKQDFFQGAKLVLDVGDTELTEDDLNDACTFLLKQGIFLCGVLSKSSRTQDLVKKMGLIAEIEKPMLKHPQNLKPLDTILSGEAALFIRKTIRSGYRVEYKGHVVVLGDVNPGAEIIASGCVIVWGRLQGTVHAGAEGDQSAVVCALDLSPTLLRIGSKIATTPQDQEVPKPEIASIMDDQIIAEPW